MIEQPLQFVIFGGTGDLAEKKLLPALFDLYKAKYLPETFSVIGLSRGDLNDESYRLFVRDALEAKNKKDYDSFLEHISFIQGDITKDSAYKNIKEYFHDCDNMLGMCTNKMFHLSVPPSLYEPVFKHLAESGLTEPCQEHHENEYTWTRVLVEKPFGNDAKEAQRLDEMLGSLFNESQIFRIDHYVAKEALQNIITFRFANSLFEPLWNSNAVESIHLKLHESFDVRDRGRSYDGVGALRDVGQNHLLQMLALIAMQDPGKNEANAIREKRAEVLQNISLWPTDKEQSILRAQYDGYQDANGVEKDSQTETFFRIKTSLNNGIWNNVPFILESGKALDETTSTIEVRFKHHESCVCPQDVDVTSHQNKIIFRIQPDEGISITFWVKKPGFDYEIEEKTLSFDYDRDLSEASRLPDAYERVLLDCIRGDQTLFISTEEIQAQWKFIMEVLEAWQDVPLLTYNKGVNASEITTNEV